MQKMVKDVAVILDVTAFHAEGGGQLGDLGRITAPTGVIEVENTKKTAGRRYDPDWACS